MRGAQQDQEAAASLYNAVAESRSEVEQLRHLLSALETGEHSSFVLEPSVAEFDDEMKKLTKRRKLQEATLVARKPKRAWKPRGASTTGSRMSSEPGNADGNK